MGGRGSYYQTKTKQLAAKAAEVKAETIATFKSKLEPAIKEFPFYWYSQGASGEEFDLKDVRYVLPTKNKKANRRKNQSKRSAALIAQVALVRQRPWLTS